MCTINQSIFRFIFDIIPPEQLIRTKSTPIRFLPYHVDNSNEPSRFNFPLTHSAPINSPGLVSSSSRDFRVCVCLLNFPGHISTSSNFLNDRYINAINPWMNRTGVSLIPQLFLFFVNSDKRIPVVSTRDRILRRKKGDVDCRRSGASPRLCKLRKHFSSKRKWHEKKIESDRMKYHNIQEEITVFVAT